MMVSRVEFYNFLCASNTVIYVAGRNQVHRSVVKMVNYISAELKKMFTLVSSLRIWKNEKLSSGNLPHFCCFYT